MIGGGWGGKKHENNKSQHRRLTSLTSWPSDSLRPAGSLATGKKKRTNQPGKTREGT